MGLDDLPEIARRLGYKRNLFTNMKYETYNGSTILLAGLIILKQLIEYERKAETEKRILDLENEAALGWKKWPKDITRHSASSYWLAVTNDARGFGGD